MKVNCSMESFNDVVTKAYLKGLEDMRNAMAKIGPDSKDYSTEELLTMDRKYVMCETHNERDSLFQQTVWKINKETIAKGGGLLASANDYRVRYRTKEVLFVVQDRGVYPGDMIHKNEVVDWLLEEEEE